MPDRTQPREDGPTPAEMVGAGVPHPARVYDYMLGGKDNFESDRATAERLMAVAPHAQQAARANREFLVRVVRTMADSGIDQFIDLGTGYPTSPNVHEVAQQRWPGARVAYVDNDPVVVAHNRALHQGPGVVALDGDIRDAQAILSDPLLTEVIDFTRPVGVLFIAVLHFVPDDSRPAEIVASFRRQLRSGSMLAISHGANDDLPGTAVRTIQETYTAATAQVVFRSRAEIEALFGGDPLLPPGLVQMSQWRPDAPTTPVNMRGLGGVAQVP